jgi:fucose permease
MIAGFGNGVADAAWNAWVGAMANSNESLGFLHGFYGLGAMLAPLIATTLITKAGWEWYMFYYLMIGGAVLEVMFLVPAFWTASGAQYRAAHPQTTEESLLEQQRLENNSIFTKILGKSRTAEAMSNKVTWLCSLFLISYVGVEVAIGGWVVTFMIRIRHATPFASGMVATGFWTGITVGRVILGFVTPRFFPTEKHATATYLVASIILELLFWLIPNFIVSAVMVSLLGFFLGPLFPAAIIAATKLLPRQLHVSAIGFAAALGAAGATILPFAVGAIAEVKGVQVLNPIAVAMIAACLAVWLCFPSMRNKHPGA